MKINRVCPYCKSIRIKIERKEGLCAFNVWYDYTCLNCGEIWEKHSKMDKISKLMAQVDDRRNLVNV